MVHRSEIRAKLLDWFDANRRDLPWRHDRTPYRVWIAEIMLQQTRVDTVIPYYENWLRLFPTVADLAAASEQDVLKAWEGLGYYSRARSLHRAAIQIMSEYGGELPSDPTALKKLPGIGTYTVGSIASIAFNQAVPALDGNIRRVYSRLFDIADPLRSKESEEKLWTIAAAMLKGMTAADRPGDYLEALMDFGATRCTPSAPTCDDCPISSHCAALAAGTVADRPLVVKKPAIPHLTVTAAVIRAPNNTVLLARRPRKGLLGGLWEFPGGKTEDNETLEDCIRREIREELAVDFTPERPFGTYRHAYTHFKITLHAFLGSIAPGQTPQALSADELATVPLNRLDGYPMGKVDRCIAARLIEEFGEAFDDPNRTSNIDRKA